MLRLRCAARSETGHVRRRNEDRYLCDEGLRLFGVADGVGGLPGGAEAAESARASVLTSFRALAASEAPDLPAIVRRAHDAVHATGRTFGPGIATTLTFGCIRAGEFRLAHAGDSRAYLWERGALAQLTEDHNVENEARRKKARGEPVAYSPIEGHAITRCLGGADAPEAEWIRRPLTAGSRYLFCDFELADFLARPEAPEDILHDLVGLILRRGAPDNATGVLVCIDEI